jgi:hypothetical protein
VGAHQGLTVATLCHVIAAEGESGEAAAEGEEEAGEAGDADAAANSDAGSTGSSRPLDYANKLLRYVAASPGQDFVKTLELRRPQKAEDDSSDGGQKPDPVPVTFRVLDEKLPLLEVRSWCWMQLHARPTSAVAEFDSRPVQQCRASSQASTSDACTGRRAVARIVHLSS